MKKTIAFLKIAEIHYSFFAACAVLIGSGSFPHALILDNYLAAICAFMLTGSFFLFNAVSSYERDRVYNLNAPLVRGAISKQTIVNSGVGLVLVSVLLSAFVNYFVLVIALISTFLIIYYNIKGKMIFPLNLIILPLTGSLTFLAGKLVNDPIQSIADFSNPGIPCITAFLVLVIATILSDCTTMEADRTFGRKTLPLLLGKSVSMTVNLVLTSLLAVVVTIPVILGYYGGFYKITAVYITALPFAAVMIIFWGNPTQKQLKYSSFAVKLVIILGLAALFGA